MTKQSKEVQIIARYIHKTNGKPNGTISYLVRASNGKDTYCTTIVNGQARGCTCPSHKPCYHMKQLEQKEAARKETAQQFAAQSVPVWTVQLVNSGKLQVPAMNVAKSYVTSTVKAVSTRAKTTDVGMKGNLNTSRAFSLMR